MTLKLTIALATVVLTALVPVCRSCSCGPVVPDREKYCKNQVGLVSNVVSNVPGSNQTQPRTYTLDTNSMKVFKGKRAMKNIPDNSTVLTPDNSGVCGVELKTGTKYLISGYIHHERQVLYLHQCSALTHVWADLTRDDKKFYKKLFKKNC